MAVQEPAMTDDIARGVCHHCGEALPATPVIRIVKGESQAYCCTGCAGAAQFISDAGLSDYYQLRAEQGQRVGEEPTDFSAFDRDDVQREHSRQVSPECREITLVVEGMRCAACSWLIDRVGNPPRHSYPQRCNAWHRWAIRHTSRQAKPSKKPASRNATPC
jgi:Cu2+-exporting ATPase